MDLLHIIELRSGISELRTSRIIRSCLTASNQPISGIRGHANWRVICSTPLRETMAVL